MAGNVLLAISCLGAFGMALIAGRAFSESIERAQSAVSLQAASFEAHQGSGDAWKAALYRKVAPLALYYLRNGVDSLRGAAAWVVRGRLGSRFVDAARLCDERGVPCTPQSLASVVCALACGVSLAALVVFRSVAAAMLLPLFGFLAFCIAVSHGCVKEQEMLREQVPDALRCMEACLHAGLSLPQSFEEVAASCERPAKDAFMHVSRDLELGYSVSAALTRFHEVAGLAELRFVAMALDVQYACGGSATPILRSAEDSIARGLELRRTLRVQTAQARLSAQVVSVMPIALLALLSVVSPGFLTPFFASTQGLCLLALALGMQVAGVLMVRRVLDVKL